MGWGSLRVFNQGSCPHWFQRKIDNLKLSVWTRWPYQGFVFTLLKVDWAMFAIVLTAFLWAWRWYSVQLPGCDLRQRNSQEMVEAGRLFSYACQWADKSVCSPGWPRTLNSPGSTSSKEIGESFSFGFFLGGAFYAILSQEMVWVAHSGSWATQLAHRTPHNWKSNTRTLLWVDQEEQDMECMNAFLS